MNDPKDREDEGLTLEWPEDAEDGARLPLTETVAAAARDPR